VTRGWLPQRVGSLDLNGGGAAAAVEVGWYGIKLHHWRRWYHL